MSEVPSHMHPLHQYFLLPGRAARAVPCLRLRSECAGARMHRKMPIAGIGDGRYLKHYMAEPKDVVALEPGSIPGTCLLTSTGMRPS